MQPMRRESPYPMAPVAEAQRIIASFAKPLAVAAVGIREAQGRVLAEAVHSPEDMPDVPKSAVDGYALRTADGVAPRRVVSEILAGVRGDANVTSLAPGAAARIMTGAPVPDGADAVIMVEQTDEHDGMLQIERVVQPGDSIHRVGQDIARGELVLPAGTPLGSSEVALLATIGQTQVMVYRRPLVAVLSTGDEVYEPDAVLGPGAIRDSNRYALLAAAREAGCDVVSLGIARDDRETQRAAILRGLEQADVLLTSGGVSMGTRDLIKPLLAELGAVHFGRVAFKPGKPTTFATVTRTASASPPVLVFGLPGYPVSSLVSFEVFVRPALRRLQGDAHPDRPIVRVVLADPIRSSPDRPEYQRVVIGFADGRLVARTTGSQGSSRLLSLRGANGLLLVPAGGQLYQPGDELEALLTAPLAQ